MEAIAVVVGAYVLYRVTMKVPPSAMPGGTKPVYVPSKFELSGGATWKNDSGPLPPHPLDLTTAGREEQNALAQLRVFEAKKALKGLYPSVTISKEEQMNPAHFASLFQ